MVSKQMAKSEGYTAKKKGGSYYNKTIKKPFANFQLYLAAFACLLVTWTAFGPFCPRLAVLAVGHFLGTFRPASPTLALFGPLFAQIASAIFGPPLDL